MTRLMTRLIPLLLAATSADAARQIPLCPGLTIVTAVNQPTGDYESIKTLESVGAREMRLKYSSQAMNMDGLSPTAGQIVTTTVYRKILTEDQHAASQYQQVFAPDSDELIPGTTSIGTSTDVLRALKTKGEGPFSISLVPPGQPLRADRQIRPHAYDYFTAGKLKRVGTVKVPVLVNERTTELTAIQARGEFAAEQSEFLFLDDEANPLTLRFRLGIDALKPMVPELKETCAQLRKTHANNPMAWAMFARDCREKPGDRDVLQVVKITYRCAGFAPRPTGGEGPVGPGEPPVVEGDASGGGDGLSELEQALQKTGKADIYSIYFTFNSDAIREESEPTLKMVGALMRKHPDWKLTINGHTDNIASDKYNLDLSRRRAAAVVKALTTTHGVAAGRLGSAGQGEFAPVDTNETLEGRAKNRRVELIRLP
jgi:outer membrane protein OmpA-like peptidoglycan-associated protein